MIADEEPFLSYYGWFNKLCKSLEQSREPAEEDWNAFHALGEGMSKSVHASMVKMLEEVKRI